MKKLILSLLLLATISLSAKNKTWICINESGETVFTIEAMRVYPFQNGLARVYKNTLVNNKWITGYGFIDKTGKVVIECKLKKAHDFKGSVTWVKFENQDYFSLIDKTGKIIPTKKYKKVAYFYSFDPDISAVYENGKMGFIDINGKEVIPCKYLGSTSFNEGLACVCDYNSVKGEYGFINKKGEVVIPLKYRQSGTSSFNEELARAKKGGKTVLIDKKGNTIFATTKGNIQGHYQKKMALIFTKPNREGWGWVNFQDKFVIQPIYDHAINFNDDGYAIVEKNGLKGMIDTTGTTLLPFKYNTIYANISEDGYFLGVYPSDKPQSLSDAKKDYFNANLQLVNNPQFNYIGPAKGGELMPFTNPDGKLGYLDKSFKIVIQPLYTRASSFSEGVAWVLK